MERANFMGSVLKIPIQPLPTLYIGVPLGGKPHSKAFWENVEEKIHKKTK